MLLLLEDHENPYVEAPKFHNSSKGNASGQLSSIWLTNRASTTQSENVPSKCGFHGSKSEYEQVLQVFKYPSAVTPAPEIGQLSEEKFLWASAKDLTKSKF